MEGESEAVLPAPKRLRANSGAARRTGGSGPGNHPQLEDADRAGVCDAEAEDIGEPDGMSIDSEEFLQELAELLPEDEAVAAPNESAVAGGAMPMPASPAQSSAGEANGPVPEASQHRHLEATSDDSAIHDAMAALFRSSVCTYGSAFKFSRKLAHSAPPYGGLEATCGFHRKNHSTGCKKIVRLTGSDPNSVKTCITSLAHWCNSATKYARQRDHLRMSLKQEDIPPPAVVDTQKLTERPPAIVKCDVELDREADALAAPASSSLGEATAKGKAKAKAKTKAKAKAASAGTVSTASANPACAEAKASAGEEALASDTSAVGDDASVQGSGSDSECSSESSSSAASLGSPCSD